MKIGFVLDDGLDSVDGVQQYVLTLGNWLDANGHEVHYIVGQTKRDDIANMHSLARNIHVRFNNNRLAIPLISSKKKINTLLDTEKFDVLHIQMPYSPHFVGRIIRHTSPTVAVIGTFHILPYGGFQALGARLLSVLNTSTIKRFNSIVSVSPAAQHFAQSTMNIKSTVVPNAVNISKFTEGKKIEKYNDDVDTIVFLGRLVERKGCLELLAAINILVQSGKFKNRRLVLCGTGPLKSRVSSYIATHNLGLYVECVGKITESEKPNYLASADVAIFPSKSGESFGIVLVEAIASGAGVVVGGDNPGYKYVLSNRREVLINPRNIHAFAEQIDNLLTEKDRTLELGKLQRSEIAQFDIEQVGTRIVAIYGSSIAKASHKLNNSNYE